MDDARWQLLKSLFAGALELEAGERRDYLVRGCAGDGALLAELISLLAAHDDAGSFLAPEDAAFTIDEVLSDRTGATVGAYRLERLLGRGGMGEVYLAERADEQYQQRVAIKIVKRGTDTAEVLRRFKAERTILARLEHPNVTRVLDAGETEDGLPYLVMELVDGEPIDRYCRKHALPLARRLELFLAVCDAVAYAQHNLVVHRDIKPGNVLVGSGGIPKLLDFGIAKLLETTGDGTVEGVRAMTLRYASPEQILGEPATTATDVHALGLLLYILLCDVHPFASADRGSAALTQAIVEEEPPRPSQVLADRRGRELRGDLDTITLKALQKQPAQRYASAADLAADLRRHLGGQPVLARAASSAYRAAKFVRRHRLGVAAVAAVALSLVGGIVATTLMARAAREERARAERRFAEVRRVANELAFDVHDAIAELPGATPVRRLLVGRAAGYLDGLAAEAGGDQQLMGELAAAYLKLGDAQGDVRGHHLGDFAGAEQTYRRGAAIVDALLRGDPDDRRAGRARAEYHERLGRLAWARGNRAAAHAELEQADGLARALLGDDPADPSLRRLVAEIQIDLGQLLADEKQEGPAGARFSESLALLRQLDTRDAAVRRSMAVILSKLGDGRARNKDPAGALLPYGESLLLRLTTLAVRPDQHTARRDVASSLTKVGTMKRQLRDPAGALETLEHALTLHRGLRADNPLDVQAQRDLAVSLAKTADVLGDLAGEARGDPARGMWKTARARYAETLALHIDLKRRGLGLPLDEPLMVRLPAFMILCDRGLAAVRD